MKKILCKELGDPNGPRATCDHVFEIESFDDLVGQATEHVTNTPTHAADFKAMNEATEDQKEQWLTRTRNTFDEKPEA